MIKNPAYDMVLETEKKVEVIMVAVKRFMNILQKNRKVDVRKQINSTTYSKKQELWVYPG